MKLDLYYAALQKEIAEQVPAYDTLNFLGTVMRI